VPPGLREPSDATPAPPPPPSGPPTTPPPTTPSQKPSSDPVAKSKALKEAKQRATEKEQAGIRLAAGKTFQQKDGRWVDTAWEAWAEKQKEDGEKAEPRRIEFLSKAWVELSRLNPSVMKILAVGEKVLFVWQDVAYEVVPAKTVEKDAD
jgi:hypothetical protein